MQKQISIKTKLIALSVAFIILAAFVIITSRTHNLKTPYSKLIRLEKKFGGKNKKTVLADLTIAKNYQMSGKLTPPEFIPAAGKIKGLKSPLKIVFGISGGDVNNFKETLGNIYYIVQYAKHYHLKYKIAVVVYGKMVSYLRFIPKSGYIVSNRISTDMLYAVKHGVKFYACYNALMINHLIHRQLPYFVKPVSMGALKIYSFRKKGYLYFTNP